MSECLPGECLSVCVCGLEHDLSYMGMSALMNLESQSGGVGQDLLLHSCFSVSSSIQWQKYRRLVSLLITQHICTGYLRGKHTDQGVDTGQSRDAEGTRASDSTCRYITQTGAGSRRQ